MTTTNAEQQETERQEEPPAQYGTLPERMAALEATQRLLIEVVRENGRRSDENYRALDAKIDRLTYLLLGAAVMAAAAVIVQLIF